MSFVKALREYRILTGEPDWVAVLMTPAKFAVGDLVDVETDNGWVTAAVVVEVEHDVGEIIQDHWGEKYWYTGYTYRVDKLDHWNLEINLRPHNPPEETGLTQLKQDIIKWSQIDECEPA